MLWLTLLNPRLTKLLLRKSYILLQVKAWLNKCRAAAGAVYLQRYTDRGRSTFTIPRPVATLEKMEDKVRKL
jgi:hypothetical protein